MSGEFFLGFVVATFANVVGGFAYSEFQRRRKAAEEARRAVLRRLTSLEENANISDMKLLRIYGRLDKLANDITHPAPAAPQAPSLETKA